MGPPLTCVTCSDLARRYPRIKASRRDQLVVRTLSRRFVFAPAQKAAAWRKRFPSNFSKPTSQTSTGFSDTQLVSRPCDQRLGPPGSPTIAKARLTFKRL